MHSSPPLITILSFKFHSLPLRPYLSQILDLTLFLFACMFQARACLDTLSCWLPRTWPTHFHFFLLIGICILSLGIFLYIIWWSIFGHLTPRMYYRHRLTKAWTLTAMFSVTLQVSAPYIKMVFTLVLNILSLVLRNNSLDLHTGLSRRKAVVVFPFLIIT